MESVPDHDTPVLVVDDDPGLLLSIKAIMVSSGMSAPALLSDSRRLVELLEKRRFQLVLLDLNMPHICGMELLEKIKTRFPDIECVIVTAVDEVSTAVQAMKFEAYDYLVKPLNSEKLIIIIKRALERYNLRYGLSLFERKQVFSDLKKPSAFKDMVAEDTAMALIFHQIEVVAPTDYSVVITGESGTGKEMVARIIHNLSNRSNAPFLAVNMAAINNTLFEGEFFGHTKGAYTGASNETKGFFETADQGTLFLDEITELDMPLQGKLLRVIEERELYRLGSTKARSADARIIAASNRNINTEIANGRFRADLFYRLNKNHINILPLRERKKDILPLARYFIKVHSKTNNKKIDALAPDLAQALLNYSFPGNVRELENIIAAAVLLENRKTLALSSARDLESFVDSTDGKTEGFLTLVELEKQHIQKALQTTGQSCSKAAKLLGINISTVYRKIEKYKIL